MKSNCEIDEILVYKKGYVCLSLSHTTHNLSLSQFFLLLLPSFPFLPSDPILFLIYMI